MKEIIKKLIPSPLLRFYYFLLSWLAAFWFSHPSGKMVVIGVTGTNGKSTVVELLSRILREAGFKVSSISSVRFELPERRWPNTLKMTMPGRFLLQRFLYDALKEGSSHVVLEVTSEGIEQFRHRFIHFDVAVLTNLTPEHIESHGSLENYKKAKEKLFRKLSSDPAKRLGGKTLERVFVVNYDDEFGQRLSGILTDKIYTYSLDEENKGITIDFGSRWSLGTTTYSRKGTAFVLGGIGFKSYLFGQYNLLNILAAVAVGLTQGVSLEQAKKAIHNVKGVPGRFERILSRKGFEVIVDYAHTPDALEKVYEAIVSNIKPKNLICVLGSAGGGRDKWKRKEMAQIAGRFCQKIVVTNEDPYDEDPQAIIDEIAQGAPLGKTLKILDRRQAIRETIKSAQKGDVVICTGKGIEPWIMGPKGQKIPWDEKEVVKQELKNLGT